MERRDQVLLLLALGGAGYAIHANWDVLNETFGLSDIKSGRVAAIEHARNERSFDRNRPNWMVLDQRDEQGKIELEEDPWDAERFGDDLFKVTCTFRDGNERRSYTFDVNTVNGRVDFLGDLPAAPR